MKEVVSGLIMRAVPAISGALVTVGVTSGHAEAIALGLAAAAVTGIEMAMRYFKR